MRRNILFASSAGLALLGVIGFSVWMFIRPFSPVSPSLSDSLPDEEMSTDGAEATGALIKVSMNGKVGVLLDEIPLNERDDLVQILFDKPESYWRERATKQLRFTTLRRNYGATWGKKSVPLPPEELWRVTVTSDPARESVDGHDFVTVRYTYDSTLLTDAESPRDSATELGTVGGVWKDKLLLPLDPDFVFQRTGFACMNESESPPNSIDAEETDFYYDQKCRVEEKLTNIGCHQTEMPTESCEEAVVAHIGADRPVMVFERVPWKDWLADQVRTGEITNPDGPDLQPIQSRFMEHRFTYRYIPADSCTLVEQCVGAAGWRQLMMFPTGDMNTGAEALDIGRVDYFHQEGGSLLADHGVYEYSACHEHYHFSHYGSFTLGDGSHAITHKQGFCLQPTSRLMNNEQSPMNHPYANCIEQGVAVGWIDEYNMGLECQWLDVSDVPPQTLPISFTTNPDGMMCEGTRKFDEDGNQLFEPTEFTTKDGEPVDRPQCDFFPDWDENNTASYEVTVPAVGESYVTEPCKDDVFGPLRNCGLEKEHGLRSCEPESNVRLRCDVPNGSPTQVVRICEASQVLQTGIPCTYNDAIGSGLVSTTVEISFTCPTARDEKETGGLYSLLTGAIIPREEATRVTCVEVSTD